MLLLLKWLLRQVCAQSSLPSLTSTVLQDALGLTLACLTPGLLPVDSFPGVPQASQVCCPLLMVPSDAEAVGWYVYQKLGVWGALLSHLGGLPFKDVVNVHGLPELHVLKGK